MNNLIDYIYIVPAALLAIILHELAHGLMSYWLGDPTPKRQGRLSLNPLNHLDLVGTLCLIFFHVGWAKPVVVNPEYYKKKKLGMFLVAFAGPFVNILVCITSMVIYACFIRICYKFEIYNENLNIVIGTFLMTLAMINLGLAIFNLLPIPPLDGSKIIGSFLKGEVYEQYMKYQQYGFIILSLILLLSSMSSGGMSFITVAVDYVFDFLWYIVCLIFGI